MVVRDRKVAVRRLWRWRRWTPNVQGIADGLARALDAPALARHCDRSYRAFLPKAGPLCVNHGAGLSRAVARWGQR